MFVLTTVCSPAVVTLLWRTCTGRLAMTIGSSVAYAVAASSLLPNVHHVMFLIGRTSGVIYLCHLDAITAAVKLRKTPEHFRREYGGQASGRSWFSIVWAGIWFCGVLLDLLRHYLVLNATVSRDVIDLGLTHRVTGNRLAYTNHQLAEACFYTSVLLCAQTISHFGRSHGSGKTVMLTTPLLLLNAEEE